jgi:hypothetical protein
MGWYTTRKLGCTPCSSSTSCGSVMCLCLARSCGSRKACSSSSSATSWPSARRACCRHSSNVSCAAAMLL